MAHAARTNPTVLDPTVKTSSALFLQVVIVLIGLGVLVLMLGEPHLEGRNAHAATFEIYVKDPFLAYAYVGSIPFFVALTRAFGLFGHVRETGMLAAERRCLASYQASKTSNRDLSPCSPHSRSRRDDSELAPCSTMASARRGRRS